MKTPWIAVLFLALAAAAPAAGCGLSQSDLEKLAQADNGKQEKIRSCADFEKLPSSERERLLKTRHAYNGLDVRQPVPAELQPPDDNPYLTVMEKVEINVRLATQTLFGTKKA